MHFDATFWVAAALVVFLFMIGKPVGRFIGRGLDGYALKVKKELDEALKLKEQAQEMLAKIEREHRNASSEAENIIQNAKDEAKRIRKDEVAKAEEALQRRMDSALLKIEQAEAAVVREIQQNAVDITVNAARTLISEHMTADNDDALIGTAVDDLEKKFH